MTPDILKVAMNQGFYALLFVALLFYVLKENKTREENYNKVIERFGNIINEDLQEVKTKLDNLM